MIARVFLVSLIALSLVGCAHPGNWDAAKVKAHIEKSMELTDFTLEPSGKGVFTGTGKAADGETYKLTVTQDEANKRLSWKYEGDRGTVGDEKYEFVK